MRPPAAPTPLARRSARPHVLPAARPAHVGAGPAATTSCTQPPRHDDVRGPSGCGAGRALGMPGAVRPGRVVTRARVGPRARRARWGAGAHLDDARERPAGQLHQQPQVQRIRGARQLKHPPRVHAHEALVEQLALLRGGGTLRSERRRRRAAACGPDPRTAPAARGARRGRRAEAAAAQAPCSPRTRVLRGRMRSPRTRGGRVPQPIHRHGSTQTHGQHVTGRRDAQRRRRRALSERPDAWWKRTYSHTCFSTSDETCGAAPWLERRLSARCRVLGGAAGGCRAGKGDSAQQVGRTGFFGLTGLAFSRPRRKRSTSCRMYGDSNATCAASTQVSLCRQGRTGQREREGRRRGTVQHEWAACTPVASRPCLRACGVWTRRCLSRPGIAQL